MKKNVVKNFIDYCELNTKLASIMPFSIALAYSFYVGYPVRMWLVVVFFGAMLLFDMAVTMINNHIDRQQAGKEGYFSLGVERAFIISFVLIATVLGIYLTMYAGLIFLLAGMVCFAVGIGYTHGPFPISRSPYGELFSGLTEGLLLPFLVVTLNLGGLVILVETGAIWVVNFSLIEIGKFVLVCLPCIISISNIMIANNICDYEEDLKTRYTMVRHIGISNSLKVFAVSYGIAYLAIVVAVMLQVLPWVCLLTLVTLPISIKNIKSFYKKQVKAETFILSIKNFLAILLPYLVTLIAGIWL